MCPRSRSLLQSESRHSATKAPDGCLRPIADMAVKRHLLATPLSVSNSPMVDFRLRPTVGLAAGTTVQFAEGRWTGLHDDEIGEGVEVADEAFDSIMPLILATCPGWTPMHRYGPYALSPMACSALVKALRSEADRVRNHDCEASSKAEMWLGLADWLDLRCEAGRHLSILGF